MSEAWEGLLLDKSRGMHISGIKMISVGNGLFFQGLWPDMNIYPVISNGWAWIWSAAILFQAKSPSLGRQQAISNTGREFLG